MAKKKATKKAPRKRTTKKKAPPAAVSTDQPPDRVNQVLNWILTGANHFEIVEAARQHWPDADAEPLIVKAITQAKEAADADPDLVNGWIFEAARYVYKQAMTANDFGAALRALKMIGDLKR